MHRHGYRAGVKKARKESIGKVGNVEEGGVVNV
jgi:hypothetical protein